ncbi:uncharacterized protein [Primulina eburnea]|uniref:uncharacterized protein n=1 Tax=Primulina eburnea TaxID=1245227 RepID=UPI003C6C68EF
MTCDSEFSLSVTVCTLVLKVYILNHVCGKRYTYYPHLFVCLCTSENMSVTFNFGSEITVTSPYVVPIIDLCSDDETKTTQKVEKTEVKWQGVDVLEPVSDFLGKRKKLKLRHPTTERQSVFKEEDDTAKVEGHRVNKGENWKKKMAGPG